MKQKTQGRELSALVPASFFFSDYDEYAVVSYSFALRFLVQYIDNKNNHSLRGQENFSSSLSYHAGAAISTGLKVLAYHGTRDSRSLWVLVQSFSSFALLIAAHLRRVQSEFKVIDFLSVTAGDHQLKPPAQRRHPFYRNLAVVG